MAEGLRDLVPASEFVAGAEERQYWIGGGRVMFGPEAATFVSAGDGYFGRDDATVFFGRAALPGATAAAWRRPIRRRPVGRRPGGPHRG